MDGDSMISLTERGLSRRTAMVGTALGSSFALSVQPVCAQTMITTPADGLTAGEVKVKTKDGKEMAAYRAMPATGQGFGTILVVQEIFGVHAHIADLCRRFAKAGYYAIAPELYFRQGDPKGYTEIPKLISEVVAKVPDEQVMGDLDAAVAFAKGEGKADTAKLGVTGFCWGGRIVWLYAAANPGLKAGVAWYGRVVGEADAAHAQASGRHRQGAEGAGARPLWRRRHRHPQRHGRQDARGAQGRQPGGAEVAHRHLSRHAARLQRRLPPELPQGPGGGCVEEGVGLVQGQRRRLIA